MIQQASSHLAKKLEVEFHKKLLAAAIAQLDNAGDPLAVNNFCSTVRELIRHVPSFLASDEEIKKCPWFQPDSTSRTGITRSHAVHFIVCGGLTEDYVTTQLEIELPEIKKELSSAIKVLNKFTHLNEATFNIPIAEFEPQAISVINALTEVLDLGQDCRAQLTQSLAHRIEKGVVSAAISETLLAIDEIATHHSVEFIDIEEIEVVSIGSTEIEISVHGNIEVELQWGSNSDVKNDTGAVANDSFPFRCMITSHTTEPEEIHIETDHLQIDTSDWFGDQDDEY
ncbi:hypothetical protein ACO0K0_15800 [Undibacterium sp. SXout11W]|uniref:pPIWI-associating nuclease domain-containing protein n=1 Tax=Undibacterium sp. SXout11W TaxID=3413050 RepID=UPI003BF3359D